MTQASTVTQRTVQTTVIVDDAPQESITTLEDATTVVSTANVGPRGPQGPAGADGIVGANGQDGQDGQDGATGPQGPASQIITVGLASTSWVLDISTWPSPGYPNITCIDTQGRVQWGAVTYDDPAPGFVTVRFNSAFSGKAVLT